MPAVQAPGKVLVTGASGFIAVWVVKEYLQRGFHVRGTVRSTSKGEYLRNLFETEFPGQFEFAIVKDIDAPGAFDEAVKGVDAVAHVASPVYFPDENEEPDVIVKQAVGGTLEILKSANYPGTTVKRVVITGSTSSVLEPHDAGYVYDDKDWNEASVIEIKEKGKAAAPFSKYSAGKTLAEKATWKFVEDHKGSLPFDVNVVMPTWVYGPVLQDLSSIADLNGTMQRFWGFFANPPAADQFASDAYSFVDVRDVARIHGDALERPELANRRIIIANPVTPAFQDFYDAYYAIPESARPKLPFEVPRGTPGAGDKTRGGFSRYDDYTAKLVGWDTRAIDVLVRDTLKSIEARLLAGKA